MSAMSRLERELKKKKPFRSPYHEATMALLRTADVLRRRLEELFAGYGITGQQYNVLRILRGARPETLPTMEIAERMIERTPGITRLVDRLEEKGFVERERCRRDRRRVLCSITGKGLALLGDLDDPVDRLDRGLVRMLDEEEVKELIGYLERIREGSSDESPREG